MEESDSGQQTRCRCGFWGSTKTMGLCSKCYKEHTEEPKEGLDPKADLRRNTDHQGQFSSHESLSAGPSSFSASARNNVSTSSRPTSAMKEKAEELIKQAFMQNKMDLVATNSTNNAKGHNSEDSEASTSKTDSASDKNVKDSVIDNTASNVKSETSTSEESVQVNSNLETGPAENRGVKRDITELEEPSPEKSGAKSKKKCAVCKCRLELAQRAIGKCRCDNVYCSLHRLPEQHHCDFDHKEDGRREARGKMIKPTRHLGNHFKRLGADS